MDFHDSHASSASSLQRAYYARTASRYDTLHLSTDDEHGVALRYVTAVVREFELQSVLDVGTGTGRAMAYLRGALRDVRVVGVEPMFPLLQVARAKTEIGCARLVSASGYRLPFADASFDAVSLFGVLHHVPDPNGIVEELTRVARRAIFVSDSNRFGQGSPAARRVKLLLAQAGLWPVANFVKTRGRGYTVTEGDGVAYSYSVFDSIQLLQRWADRLVVIPTSMESARNGWSPLLASSHVLACAIRE